MIQFPQVGGHQGELVFFIEKTTKEVGEAVVLDIERNGNLTQVGVMNILPKIAEILAKKETLNNMYNNSKI